MKEAERYSILVMSTAHLQEETIKFLNGGAYPISYVNSEGFGTVIRITESDFEDEDYPEDLMDCMRFAHANGCDYIRFDGDGPVYDLPTYEWDQKAI